MFFKITLPGSQNKEYANYGVSIKYSENLLNTSVVCVFKDIENYDRKSTFKRFCPKYCPN